MLWFSKTSLINCQILSYSYGTSFTAFQSGFKNWIQIIILLFLQFIFSGCDSVNHFIKAEPASHARFLPAPELFSEMRKRYPFHGVWMNMNIEDFHNYNAIYIALGLTLWSDLPKSMDLGCIICIATFLPDRA